LCFFLLPLPASFNNAASLCSRPQPPDSPSQASPLLSQQHTLVSLSHPLTYKPRNTLLTPQDSRNLKNIT
ncbi:unnamed protein product, partial [Brassica oleracea]